MDSIDRKLLSLLQDDASMALQDIAARVGLSVNPCWRRIKRMESEGIIRARVAVQCAPRPLDIFESQYLLPQARRPDGP